MSSFCFLKVQQWYLLMNKLIEMCCSWSGTVIRLKVLILLTICSSDIVLQNSRIESWMCPWFIKVFSPPSVCLWFSPNSFHHGLPTDVSSTVRVFTINVLDVFLPNSGPCKTMHTPQSQGKKNLICTVKVVKFSDSKNPQQERLLTPKLCTRIGWANPLPVCDGEHRLWCCGLLLEQH